VAFSVAIPDPDVSPRAAVIERAIAARIAQGLPPTVEDPAALARVAAIVATSGAEVSRARS
jgi:hypothetical protein